MTEPRRKRITNGQPRSEYREDYFCKYGKHLVYESKFITDSDNKGICLDCALEVHLLLYRVMEIPIVGPKEALQLRKLWEGNRSHVAAVKLLKGASNDPGWVYYVGQANLVKIGYATDVTRRIRAYGPTAELLAVHPGTPALEKQMHAKFKSSLDSGREWFRRDDVLLEHIESVVSRFGSPAVFEHAWTKPRTDEEKVRSMFNRENFAEIAAGAHAAV